MTWTEEDLPQGAREELSRYPNNRADRAYNTLLEALIGQSAVAKTLALQLDGVVGERLAAERDGVVDVCVRYLPGGAALERRVTELESMLRETRRDVADMYDEVHTSRLVIVDENDSPVGVFEATSNGARVRVATAGTIDNSELWAELYAFDEDGPHAGVYVNGRGEGAVTVHALLEADGSCRPHLQLSRRKSWTAPIEDFVTDDTADGTGLEFRRLR